MDAWHNHIWRGDKLVEWESRVWDAADDARLTLLWAEGMSTVQIGLRIGRTKSAAIGRARRLGLLPRPSPLPGPPKPRAVQVASKPLREPPSPEPQVQIRIVRPDPPAAAPPPELPPAAPPLSPHVRSVVLFPVSTCQWIEGFGPEWTKCDCPTVDHGSWCAAHRRRVFVGRVSLIAEAA